MTPTKNELISLLEIAKHAANLAAAIHQRAIESRSFKIDTKSSKSDLVTEVDRSSEQELVKAIRAARPDDEIIGEEGTNLRGTTGVRWILDPLAAQQTSFTDIRRTRLLSEFRFTNAT